METLNTHGWAQVATELGEWVKAGLSGEFAPVHVDGLTVNISFAGDATFARWSDFIDLAEWAEPGEINAVASFDRSPDGLFRCSITHGEDLKSVLVMDGFDVELVIARWEDLTSEEYDGQLAAL